MDIGNLLFNPNGRIDQQNYWVGVLIIISGNIILAMLPLIGVLIWLGLIYVGICVYGKRLHDTGRSAWVHAVPWALNIVLFVAGLIVAGGAMITAIMAAGPDGNVSPFSIIAAGSSFFIISGLGTLVWLAYTIWLGIQQSQPGDNQYGPQPVANVIDGKVDN